jgi:hypothetical protein
MERRSTRRSQKIAKAKARFWSMLACLSALALALARGLLDEAAIVGVTASPDPVPPQSSKTVRTPLLAGVNTEVLKIIEDIVGSTGLMR